MNDERPPPQSDRLFSLLSELYEANHGREELVTNARVLRELKKRHGLHPLMVKVGKSHGFHKIRVRDTGEWAQYSIGV